MPAAALGTALVLAARGGSSEGGTTNCKGGTMKMPGGQVICRPAMKGALSTAYKTRLGASLAATHGGGRLLFVAAWARVLDRCADDGGAHPARAKPRIAAASKPDLHPAASVSG